MKATVSSSSSPAAEDRLIRVPLDRLHSHPANANLMGQGYLAKLATNIQREGRYPPLVVRPHPTIGGDYELLDGHQRAEVLRRLGEEEALCFPWPCDDATALILLATLNRLEGEDVPARRAELLRQLTELVSADELALLLPEDAAVITNSLCLLDLDSEALLRELEAAGRDADRNAPRLLSFAVSRDDEAVVERAIASASADLIGANKRGRALALMASAYLEERNG